MFCPRCNNPLEEHAAFCGDCGALIKPKRDGETVLETPSSIAPNSLAGVPPTVYAAPLAPMPQPHSTMVASGHRLPNEQSASQGSTRETPLPHMPSPRKDGKRNSQFFVWLAILVVVVVVIGGLSWSLAKTGFKTASPTSAQVSFLDGQNKAPGTTSALRITATGLPNPPEGSEYDAWLIDATNEQVLPLGSLSKSDPTTFALSYSDDSSQSSANLVGAGNKIEITQEQGKATSPTGKVVLSATFPPLALVHIRHLLFKFPSTPGNIGLLPGLVNETQKVSALSLMLQNNVSNPASVACIAQAMLNVIEGKSGANSHPLAANCASVGIGNAVTGDSFGLLGNGKDGGYIPFAANHAVLAASQSDTTETIRQAAKDVQTSTASVKGLMTKIDSNALELVNHPATTTQVSEIVSLSDRAIHGFDQNGNGKIEPIAGEAGALTAYTNGQRTATLTLSEH